MDGSRQDRWQWVLQGSLLVLVLVHIVTQVQTPGKDKACELQSAQLHLSALPGAASASHQNKSPHGQGVFLVRTLVSLESGTW